MDEEQSRLIKDRLKTRLHPDEAAQVECRIDFSDREGGGIKFSAKGFADVVKDDTVYELKFVSELTHEHFFTVRLLYDCNGFTKGNFMEYER